MGGWLRAAIGGCDITTGGLDAGKLELRDAPILIGGVSLIREAIGVVLETRGEGRRLAVRETTGELVGGDGEAVTAADGEAVAPLPADSEGERRE